MRVLVNNIKCDLILPYEGAKYFIALGVSKCPNCSANPLYVQEFISKIKTICCQQHIEMIE